MKLTLVEKKNLLLLQDPVFFYISSYLPFFGGALSSQIQHKLFVDKVARLFVQRGGGVQFFEQDFALATAYRRFVWIVQQAADVKNFK